MRRALRRRGEEGRARAILQEDLIGVFLIQMERGRRLRSVTLWVPQLNGVRDWLPPSHHRASTTLERSGGVQPRHFLVNMSSSGAASSSGKLRVGYVPEHFSMPLLQLAESSWGKEHIALIAQPSGTGQMLTSFHAEDPSKRQIDVAIALTEALTAGLAKGRGDYELVGTYVTSSLNW